MLWKWVRQMHSRGGPSSTEFPFVAITFRREKGTGLLDRRRVTQQRDKALVVCARPPGTKSVQSDPELSRVGGTLENAGEVAHRVPVSSHQVVENRLPVRNPRAPAPRAEVLITDRWDFTPGRTPAGRMVRCRFPLGLRQTHQKASLCSIPLVDDDLALNPATVTAAVERIAAACQPQAIVVFGSRARGQARPDSDLDLFVLLHAPATDAGVLRRRLRALLADLPLSKDILVSDPTTYAHARTRLNSVYGDIAAENLPLWRDGHLDPAAVEAVCR